MATPQPLVVQFWDGSAWTDQTVFSGSAVQVTRGTDGESGLRPAKFTAELDNVDNRYDILDPTSPLYGIATRNMRVRTRVDDVTRTQAEASAFAPFTPVAGRGRCDLTAEGILRRILQWDTPLHSSAYRMITGFSTLVGYWPLEDGSDATQLTNAARNGAPASAGGVSYSSKDGPGGSDRVIGVATDTLAVGTFATTGISTTAGWQISFMVKLSAIPAAIGFYPLLIWYTSNGYMWTADVDDNEYRWTVRDAVTGTIIKTMSSGFGTGAAPDQWITFRIKVTASAGTVTVEPGWYPEGAPVLYGVTDTFAGTVGRLTRWRLTGNPNNNGAAMGHLFAVTGGTTDLQTGNVLAAFNGYPRERAVNRYLRLCDEEGIDRYLTGVAAESPLMGVQRPATLKQLLDEVVATDGGVIFDERTDLALRLVTRRAMYRQTPAAEFVFPDDLAPPLTKIIDDLGIKNLITVSNRGGGEYVAERTDGDLATSVIGVAKDTVDVNLADEAELADIGSWYLNRGTINRARYKNVTLNLGARPDLIAAAEAVEIGSLITITGLEYELVRLIVIGSDETIGHTSRKVTFTCLPADVFEVGIYDNDDRYDAQTSTLAEALTRTETIWDIQCEDIRDAWSTTSLPYDVVVGGEVCQMYEMSAPTGTGPFLQTGRTVRSVNGVFKTHAIGAEIHLADPVRYG